MAQLAHFYFSTDSDYEVVAFTADSQFLDSDSFTNLPLVDFKDVTKQFSPQNHSMFVPMTQTKMGHLRKEKFLAAKGMGYSLATYVSSKATFFNTPIGENCFVFEDNTIQPFTKIGNNVVLWSGNHIGHHSVLQDHIFLTSHVVISGHCTIEDHCFFGVNSTVRDQVTIREGTLVAMGASITKETEPYCVYMGAKQFKKENVRSTDLM